MPRYVAFLSSVNVGQNQVKMDALSAAMKDAGFGNVETVTASGNVIFDHLGEADGGLAAKIADVVAGRFGFRTFAAVRSRDQVAAAISENPFNGVGEDRFVHTHFLDGHLTAEGFAALNDFHCGPEKLAPGPRELYVDYTNGVGKSKLTKAIIDRKIGLQGTARNMRSLARILDRMDRIAE